MMTIAESPTVYIIDDDPGSRESLSALVAAMGLDAQSFDSAESFLSSYDPDRPGCVVTDLRMPRMTGLELQQRLREAGTPLPVIIVSGYANVPDTVRAMRGGAITLLEKPFDDRDLRTAVNEALVRNARCRKDVHWRRDARARLATLTPSERQVMRLLLEGKPNKTIATELDAGIRTIERQRHNIQRKMVVDSLAELARLMARLEEEDEGDL